MDCRDVREVLLGPAVERVVAVQEHLQACPACAELAADGGVLARELGDAEEPPHDLSELHSSVQVAIAADQGPAAWLRSLPTPVRIGLALGTAVLLVVFGGVAVLRGDIEVYPWDRMATAVGLLAFAGILMLLQRLRPLHEPPTRRGLLDAMIGLSLLLPILLAVLPAAHLDHDESLRGAGADFATAAISCALYGTVFALPLIVLLVALKRRTKPSLSMRLLAAGTTALLGNLVLQLHCPITMPLHLVAGHASLALLYAVVVIPSRA